MKPISYARHRFPPDVIRHAVWLYLRFTLSYRDVEDLLAERGLIVSNEWVDFLVPGGKDKILRRDGKVYFSLPPDPDVSSIPTSALIFRQHGLEVAVIGEDNRIVLKKISIGRNLGSSVEVLSGLLPDDRVVISPPDSLAAGDAVRVASGTE
jgi:multidrug efflux pump subunit AcrA (membrane-fusion protein)